MIKIVVAMYQGRPCEVLSDNGIYAYICVDGYSITVPSHELVII